MKRTVFLMVGLALGAAAWASEGVPVRASDAVRQARRDGADTCVIFRVTDEDGAPVVGARVRAAFYMRGERGHVHIGETDADGLFTATGTSLGEVNYTVTKAGFYASKGRVWRAGTVTETAVVTDGKWQPYGAEERVRLRPKKNPLDIAPRIFRKSFPSPLDGESRIGVDLEVGDFVAPSGRGRRADFTVALEEGADGVSQCILEFPEEDAGAVVLDKDVASVFTGVYRADPEARYSRRLVLPIGKGNVALDAERFLVLRTRTVRALDGTLREACYAQLDGPIRIDRTGLVFRFFRNPTVNETNLEACTETHTSR